MKEENENLDPQRKEAFLRIDKKLYILEEWIDEGIPFQLVDGNKQVDPKGRFILEYFPTSVRGLRLWNGKQNSDEAVKEYEIPTTQTSDTAWKAAPNATRMRAEGNEDRLSIFDLLKEKAEIQSSNKQKTRIQELEEQLRFGVTNREGLANALIQLRLDNKYLENELSTAESRLADARHVMKQQLEYKTKQIQQAQIDIKTLNNLVGKIKAILVENNIDTSEIEKTTSVIKFSVTGNDK